MKTIKDKLRAYFIQEEIGCQENVEDINFLITEHVLGLLKTNKTKGEIIKEIEG